jgi:hypothetical protein
LRDTINREFETYKVLKRLLISYNFLQEKAAETTKQKGERRKRPEPEEQEGMPEHQHCLPAKHREDRNPESHEEQPKDVA